MGTSTSPEVEVILLPFTHHTSLIPRPCDRVRPGNEANAVLICLSSTRYCQYVSGYCQCVSGYCQYVSGYCQYCLRILSVHLRILSVCLGMLSVRLGILYPVSQLTVGGGGLEIVAVVLGDRGLLLGVWPLERL